MAVILNPISGALRENGKLIPIPATAQPEDQLAAAQSRRQTPD